MKKQEEFPIDKDLIKGFIEANRSRWKKVRHTNQAVYVNFSMVRMQIPWILPKLLFAKGIEESTGAKVYVITWKSNELLKELIESFGFYHLVLEELNQTNYTGLIRAVLYTFKFMIFDGTGEGLKKIKIDHISVGKNLYEDIIRNSPLSTIKNARNKICLKKSVHLLWTYYSLNKFCKKNNPAFIICDDVAYHEGMFLKLFYSYGALVYNISERGGEQLKLDKSGNIMRSAFRQYRMIKDKITGLDDDCIKWSENYLRERYKGMNGRNIDKGAFLNKKVLSRQEIMQQLHLDPNKKNVIIMAHTFTDGVFNYGDLYFRDYYDWTEKTLSLAQSIDTVNWILKPHPTRSAYNESTDSIENMYKKYKKPHIYLLPDDVSSESIRYIADIIVTIGSNAGAEFACEGIPSIIVGKPYYRGFGFTIEPSSLEEYKKCLRDIAKIEKLSDEQIVLAKKVFYLQFSDWDKNNNRKFSDEFAQLLQKEYCNMTDMMALQYFQSNKGTEDYNNQALQKVTEFFRSHNMTDCEYYQKGKLEGKQKLGLR